MLLTLPHSLEQPWIYEDPPPPLVDSDVDEVPDLGLDGLNGESGYDTPPRRRVASSNNSESSSVSLGDTHIWRD